MSEPISEREMIFVFADRLDSLVTSAIAKHSQELTPVGFADISTLWNLQKPRFWRLYGELGVAGFSSEAEHTPDDDLDNRLAQVGLTGKELEIKVRLFDDAADAYYERPSPSKFGTALGVADVTLGSLVKVFTFLDPVKEAKEAIESLFSQGRGWLRKRFRRQRR